MTLRTGLHIRNAEGITTLVTEVTQYSWDKHIKQYCGIHFSLCSAKRDHHSIRINHDKQIMIMKNVSALSANTANTIVGQAELDDIRLLKCIPNKRYLFYTSKLLLPDR